MSHFPFFEQELEKIANAKLRALEMLSGAVPGAALGVGMVRQDRGSEPMGDPELAAGLLGAGAGAIGAGLSGTLIRHLRAKKAVDKAVEKAEVVAKKDHQAKIFRMEDAAQAAHEKQLKEIGARGLRQTPRSARLSEPSTPRWRRSHRAGMSFSASSSSKATRSPMRMR